MEAITAAVIAGVASLLVAIVSALLSRDKSSKLLKYIEACEKIEKTSLIEDSSAIRDAYDNLVLETAWQIHSAVDSKGQRVAMLFTAMLLVLVVYAMLFFMLGYFDLKYLWAFLVLFLLMGAYVVVFYAFVRSRRKRIFERKYKDSDM